MSSILFSLPELLNSYKKWVSKNPQMASDYETSAKWISYFITGRINNSHVVSELVYCLSNLLVLFNDGIIRKSLQITVKSKVDEIKLWLAIVEYSEVFCELSVQKIWGNRGRWIVIVAIQAFKCIARLMLVYKHKEATIENPPLPPLERGKLVNKNGNKFVDLGQTEFKSVSFTLKRSGRVIRKVESSPPLGSRTWKPLEINGDVTENKETSQGSLAKRQLVAETIYITKPLVHLLSMGVFGTKAWKPWMISLAMDLASLQLYKSTQKNKHALDSLTKKQKLQLSKRTMLLLLYLIRSPVYENYSENKINAFLAALSNNIPLVRIICNPLMQYLPFWQSNYFYMWSS
ncbi:unnamed protein product [Ceutorhynchus assimilis]|uniref:Peroxisomal membrane protein PEX16 n=1 Tax=Ceutorhynchus assimilis TaxID=467358 RepID=A0A9N9QIG5_9CUCU|nr:unnamed protein product [Ceutorhynchus assimilis]